MPQIIDLLTQKISQKADLIEEFFTQKFAQTPPNFYNSIDLRHFDIKIAPVDTNCFPAGFNNLSVNSKEKAKIIAKKFIEQNFKDAKNIIIIPENHTRNLRYLENISVLQEILQNDENQVVIGSLIEDLEEKLEISLENGKKITLFALKKQGNKLSAGEIEADLAILNNDLTSGIPEILKNTITPITPSPDLGWFQRTKSNHFEVYNQLAEEISQILDIDPWLISSMHRSCHEVNFKENVGLECLAKYVDELLKKIQEKYDQYGIKSQPYCYIKADQGTYGMAVMPVFSSQDALEINKKERNKMNMLKGSTQNTMAMIQEGIMTADKINDKIAEPMIYMIAGQVVGNLFRSNDQRDSLESLNSAGMDFYDLEQLTENQTQIGATKNDIALVYSLIARLAALAAARETY